MAEKDASSIVLWDGREYSARDVDRVSRRLAEYARHNESLVEAWPAHQRRFANSVFAIVAGLAAVFLLPSLVIWVVARGVYGPSAAGAIQPLVPALLSGGAMLLLACIGWAYAYLHYSAYRPTVTVQGGAISVRSGSHIPVVSSSIQQCCWFHGWVTDTILTRHGPGGALQHRAIVIQFPRQSRFTVTPRIAVGLTPEMHAIWKDFLTLAEIPQISRAERGSLHGVYGASK